MIPILSQKYLDHLLNVHQAMILLLLYAMSNLIAPSPKKKLPKAYNVKLKLSLKETSYPKSAVTTNLN